MILILILSAVAGFIFALLQVYYRYRKEKRLINRWDSCNKNLDNLINEINKKGIEDKLSLETYIILHRYESRRQFTDLNLVNHYVSFEPNLAFLDYPRKNREFVGELAYEGYKAISQ